MPVKLVAPSPVDGRKVVCNLLVAFARVRGSQFVEAFEGVLMENISGGADDALLEIKVAFVRCDQVAATVG